MACNPVAGNGLGTLVSLTAGAEQLPVVPVFNHPPFFFFLKQKKDFFF